MFFIQLHLQPNVIYTDIMVQQSYKLNWFSANNVSFHFVSSNIHRLQFHIIYLQFHYDCVYVCVLPKSFVVFYYATSYILLKYTISTQSYLKYIYGIVAVFLLKILYSSINKQFIIRKRIGIDFRFRLNRHTRKTWINLLL